MNTWISFADFSDFHSWIVLIVSSVIVIPSGERSFFNPDKVITSLQINLGDYLGSINMISHLIHKREQVPILDGNLIETSIIDTKPQAPPMRFWNEENRCASRRF